MKILIDFDYTLFDTHALRDSLVAVLSTIGVTKEEYQQGEATITAEGHYSLDKHIALLAEQHQEELLFSLIDEVMRNTAPFLYDDAIDFLKRHQEHDLIVLSYGNKGFQREKIFATGIQDYVQEIVVVEDSKLDALEEWSGEQLISINDKGPEIDEMQNAYPDMKSIWIRRPLSKHVNKECTLAFSEQKDLQFNVEELLA